MYGKMTIKETIKFKYLESLITKNKTAEEDIDVNKSNNNMYQKLN